MITVSPYFAPGLGYTSMKLAQKAIRDLRNYNKIDTITKDMAVANRIIDIVCERFDLSKSELISANRSATPKTARHIASDIIYQKTKLTKTAIGDLFNRHHTTVIHSIQTIEDWRKFDATFNKTYLKIFELV